MISALGCAIINALRSAIKVPTKCAGERYKSTNNKSAGERYKITLQKRLGALYVKITKSALGRAIKIHH